WDILKQASRVQTRTGEKPKVQLLGLPNRKAAGIRHRCCCVTALDSRSALRPNLLRTPPDLLSQFHGRGRGLRLPKRRRRKQGGAATGNAVGRGGSRRSAMAASSAGTPASQFNPADLFLDPPPGLRLSREQLSRCSEAHDVLKKKLRSPSKLTREFDLLQEMRVRRDDMIRKCSVALQGANLNKNRYMDVLPYDDSRVVLSSSKGENNSGSGYINASLITSPTGNGSRFIATQGPLPNTFEDFWEMVLQYRCPVIIMLTMVDNAKSEEAPLPVLHIQYPEWPDHGVPEDTVAVRDILKRMYHVPPDLGPIIVHCSAGIGRTGTYCAIHNAIQRILVGDMSSLDLVKTITNLRSQRVGMVQTLVSPFLQLEASFSEQYFLCYQAIVDELHDLVSNSRY
ncbi:hypothetical protein Taro_003511, partial [Colocasia esculenta]|nr:hypothetical protein [Colocasia esculenta]